MQDAPLTIRFGDDKRTACGAFGVQEMEADKGGCGANVLDEKVMRIEAMERWPRWSATANALKYTSELALDSRPTIDSYRRFR